MDTSHKQSIYDARMLWLTDSDIPAPIPVPDQEPANGGGGGQPEPETEAEAADEDDPTLPSRVRRISVKPFIRSVISFDAKAKANSLQMIVQTECAMTVQCGIKSQRCDVIGISRSANSFASRYQFTVVVAPSSPHDEKKRSVRVDSTGYEISAVEAPQSIAALRFAALRDMQSPPPVFLLAANLKAVQLYPIEFDASAKAETNPALTLTPSVDAIISLPRTAGVKHLIVVTDPHRYPPHSFAYQPLLIVCLHLKNGISLFRITCSPDLSRAVTATGASRGALQVMIEVLARDRPSIAKHIYTLSVAVAQTLNAASGGDLPLDSSPSAADSERAMRAWTFEAATAKKRVQTPRDRMNFVENVCAVLGVAVFLFALYLLFVRVYYTAPSPFPSGRRR